MPGTLYVVATPIGNLKDITFRAVETLKSVDLIACEDTRHSKILLQAYGIDKPVTSFFDQSEKRKTPFILEKIKAGQSVALISDAGTPGIADPGFKLIQGALREGLPVQAMPGASAVIMALVLSGLPSDRFCFEGFFPVKSGQRRNRLKAVATEDRTVIFYESPHRILKTLEDIEAVYGDVEIVVARELTKKFEEVLRAKVSAQRHRFSQGKVLGEFVVLFNLKEQGKLLTSLGQ